MESKLAKIISIIFQPLLMPTYGFIVLFNINVYFTMMIPWSARWIILAIVFVSTFVLPLFFILVLYHRGVVGSLHLEKRKERILPLIITVVFYYMCYYLLKRLQISPIFYYFLIGTTFTLVISLIINFFWKISMHMMAAGGLLGVFLGLSFVLMINIPFILMGIILSAGLIGFARLKLRAHTPGQVYAGFLTGALIMFILFIFI